MRSVGVFIRLIVVRCPFFYGRTFKVFSPHSDSVGKAGVLVFFNISLSFFLSRETGKVTRGVDCVTVCIYKEDMSTKDVIFFPQPPLVNRRHGKDLGSVRRVRTEESDLCGPHGSPDLVEPSLCFLPTP